VVGVSFSILYLCTANLNGFCQIEMHSTVLPFARTSQNSLLNYVFKHTPYCAVDSSIATPRFVQKSLLNFPPRSSTDTT
jgi:hypothetical protein